MMELSGYSKITRGLRRLLAGGAMLSALMLGAPMAMAQDHDPAAILRFATEYDVVSWDPHRSGYAFDRDMLFAVYDRLVHRNVDGSYSPSLAESWERNADATSWTFKLRPNVKFHDGALLDAEVVRKNILRAQTLEGSSAKLELSVVNDVVVLDPLTLRFDLAQANAIFPDMLSRQAGAIISPNSLENQDIGIAPVGAGMFTFKEHVRGSHVTLERFADYWNPDEALLAGLEIKIISDSTTRVNGLLSGELDVTSVPSTEIERVQAAGVSVDTSPSLSIAFLLFDVTKPPLDNKLVRQAMSYAVDRDAIVKALEFGYGQPTRQFVSPISPEYLPELEGTYPYDPEKAKALLQQSGVRDLQIILLTAQGRDSQMRTQQVLQAQLNAVGFDVKLESVEVSRTPEILFGSKTVHGASGTLSGNSSGLEALNYAFHSTGRVNMAKVALPPQLDAMFAEAYAAESPEKAKALVHEMSRLISDEANQLPLYVQVTGMGVAEGISGIKPATYSEFRFNGVKKAK